MASRLGRTGEFRVIVKEGASRYRTVTRSTRFDVPSSGVIPEEGQALAVHRELVMCLIAAGWRQENHGGRWSEQVFVRPHVASNRPAVDRSVVVLRTAGEKARFEALLLGEYGSAKARRASRPFPRSSDADVEPAGDAKGAHQALLDELAADGWQVSSRLDPWYVVALERRRAPWP